MMRQTISRIAVTGAYVVASMAWLLATVVLFLNAIIPEDMHGGELPGFSYRIWWLDLAVSVLMAIVFYGSVIEIARRFFVVR